MSKNFPKIYWFLFVFLFLFANHKVNAQKWVADSITINFGNETQRACSFSIVEATDLRNEFPEFISVYEKKKALFFPVDQVVKTALPLNDNFQNRFRSDSAHNENYSVNIHRFYLKQFSSFRKRNYALYSTLELNKLNEKDTIFLGTFYYELGFFQPKKEALNRGYENLIDQWSKNFISDVIAVNNELDLVLGDNLYHFRRNANASKKNLYTKVEAFAGLNFWGIDGEIWFSEPEGNRIYNRRMGLMRYMNHPTFQSIAIGRNVRLWNYRIDEKLLFTHKMALLIGFNNWKDMETVPHKLEEILNFNLSFTQGIQFNSFDKTGLVFGLGIMENVHYIIYHQPEIKIGLALNAAYKF